MNKAEMFIATAFDDIDNEIEAEEEKKSSARLPIENFLDHQQDFLQDLEDTFVTEHACVTNEISSGPTEPSE